jgi:hypothetical protein
LAQKFRWLMALQTYSALQVLQPSVHLKPLPSLKDQKILRRELCAMQVFEQHEALLARRNQRWNMHSILLVRHTL